MKVWFSGSQAWFIGAFLAIATDQMVIEKSLQRPISVDAHDKQFVQCVSPSQYRSLQISEKGNTLFKLGENRVSLGYSRK